MGPEQVVLMLAAMFVTLLPPAMIKRQSLSRRLVLLSRRCREFLVRLYPEHDTELYEARAPYIYQRWGRMGGAQAELIFHTTPTVERLNLRRLPPYIEWARGAVDLSWEQITRMHVTLALGPFDEWGDLDVHLAREDIDAQLELDLDELGERTPLGDAEFDEVCACHGDPVRLMALLPEGIRRTLVRMHHDPEMPLVRLTLHEKRLRITWSFACATSQMSPIEEAMALLLARWRDALYSAPRDELATLSRELDAAIRRKEGAHILELVLTRHPDSDLAAQALRGARRVQDHEMLLLGLLRAPHLMEDVDDPRALLDWGARHHHDAALRRACINGLLEEHLEDPRTAQTLEHMGFHEEHLELRARVLTRAITLGAAVRLDRAGLLLSGQRLAHHEELSAAGRQQLQLALLECTATPTAMTYARIAREHDDKILRYSSLRALVSKFSEDPLTPTTLAMSAAEDPMAWISEWCIKELTMRAEGHWHDPLADLTRDGRAPYSARLFAALMLDRSHAAVCETLLSTPKSTSVMQRAVGVVIARHGRRTALLERALERASSEARGELLAILIQRQETWIVELVRAHIWKAQPRHTRRVIAHVGTSRPKRASAYIVEEMLIELLRHRDLSTQRDTIDALGLVGTRRALPELSKVITHTPVMRDRVHDATQQIRARHDMVRKLTSDGGLTLVADEEDRGALTISDAYGAVELVE